MSYLIFRRSLVFASFALPYSLCQSVSSPAATATVYSYFFHFFCDASKSASQVFLPLHFLLELISMYQGVVIPVFTMICVVLKKRNFSCLEVVNSHFPAICFMPYHQMCNLHLLFYNKFIFHDFKYQLFAYSFYVWCQMKMLLDSPQVLSFV
jgi:hypothetical protein